MSFWGTVFAVGVALTIDRVSWYVLRHVATWYLKRKFVRADLARAGGNLEHWPSCFLCGYGVGCPVGRQCAADTHAHPECLDDIDQEPAPGTCVGIQPNA